MFNKDESGDPNIVQAYKCMCKDIDTIFCI